MNGTIDKQSALTNALKIEKINDVNVFETGSYEATLSNGENVTIHERKPSGGGTLDIFDICAFVSDNLTLAVVKSKGVSIDGMRTFLKSLKIGEIP